MKHLSINNLIYRFQKHNFLRFTNYYFLIFTKNYQFYLRLSIKKSCGKFVQKIKVNNKAIFHCKIPDLYNKCKKIDKIFTSKTIEKNLESFSSATSE